MFKIEEEEKKKKKKQNQESNWIDMIQLNLTGTCYIDS